MPTRRSTEKAAALLHSLARNHPFIDANKRTAWAAAAVFYTINGHMIGAEPGQIVALMVDVAEGQLDVPNIAAKLKEWAHPVEPLDGQPGPATTHCPSTRSTGSF